jgi:hypothetical protein
VTPVTPTCDITADVTAVLPGGTFRITWNGTPTDAIFKVNGTAVIASDSATYTFPANQNTATFTFTGDNNGLTCSDTVVVNKINPGNPVCTLTAAPTQVTVGGLSKLTWTATNAVGTATINQGVGSVNPNNSAGFRNVTPPTTTTYTMTVQNSAGVTASCTATVSVVPVEPLPPTCDLFTAQPTSIVRGDNSTLTWTTSNASSVVINNGVGSGTVDGTVTVSPLDTTTYTLTATGGNSQTVSCAVTVVVTNPPVDTVPVCNSFTASVTSLPAGGGNTTLTWATSRATTVSINPLLGSVSVDGSQVVAITATTDFVLTATDADGDTKTCAVKVLVAPVDTSITCAANVNFTASPSSIDEGDNATLSWNTTGITSLSINNGVSATALDGSTVVSPNSDTTYTMTATDGNDTIYCR